VKRRAVTILEILVALSLLALTLTFVLNLVPGSLFGRRTRSPLHLGYPGRIRGLD